MKKVELLSLSAVTAALIMTGCSSDDNNKGGAIPPSEISGVVEMNATSAKNAIYALTNGGASMTARRAARQALAAKLAPALASGSDNASYTYDCDISGSYSYTYASSYTGEPWNSGNGESWSNDYAYSYNYNNCVDNYSTTITIDGVNEPVTQRTYNGTYAYTGHSEYNADTNMSKDAYSGSDNYTDARENNETLTSRVYTYNTTYSSTGESEGEGWTGSADATYKYTWKQNGEYSRLDTNSTGSIRDGYKYVYGNQSGTDEGVQDYSSGTYTENGFYTRYDVNASGELEFDYGYNFDHFTMTYSEAGNESNNTVSGGYGDECLGGTVTFATAPVVQENQADYFDGDGLTGSNVLPYAGGVTMTGTSTASVAFTSDDTNHTSALLSVDGSDENLTRWSDLAVQNCVN